jgi:hypothetical protein
MHTGFPPRVVTDDRPATPSDGRGSITGRKPGERDNAQKCDTKGVSHFDWFGSLMKPVSQIDVRERMRGAWSTVS